MEKEFEIISKETAKFLWNFNDKGFLILTPDGTDRYAENFDTWEEIEDAFPDAMFALEI